MAVVVQSHDQRQPGPGNRTQGTVHYPVVGVHHVEPAGPQLLADGAADNRVWQRQRVRTLRIAVEERQSGGGGAHPHDAHAFLRRLACRFGVGGKPEQGHVM